MLSARNQLPGTVKSVKLGGIMAEVVIAVGEFEIVAAITRGSAEHMQLKEGDQVRAVIKATEVLIDKGQPDSDHPGDLASPFTFLPASLTECRSLVRI